MTPLTLLLAVTTAQPPQAAPTEQTLRVSIESTSAFGVSNARFFNQLVSARFERQFGSRFSFGGTLSYVNLKGKDERVHNVLPETTAAYRLPLASVSVGLPLRWSLGFLPKNGPTLRLGAGLDFKLADEVSLALVPAEVMVWVTRERPEVSLDACLSLGLAF